MTLPITLNDIHESTNTVLRHAKNKAMLDGSPYPESYVIGYVTSFVETFFLRQPQEVRQAYLDHVKRTIETD